MHKFKRHFLGLKEDYVGLPLNFKDCIVTGSFIDLNEYYANQFQEELSCHLMFSGIKGD